MSRILPPDHHEPPDHREGAGAPDGPEAGSGALDGSEAGSDALDGSEADEVLRAFVEHPVEPMSAADASALRERVVRALESDRRANVVRLVEERASGLADVDGEAEGKGGGRAGPDRRARRADAAHGRWRPWVVFAVAASVPVLVWAAASRLSAPRHLAGGRSRDAARVTLLAGHAEIAHTSAEPAIAVGSDTPLGAGDELRTGSDATARASLPTGAVVDVGPSARMRFEAAGGDAATRDRIELVDGRIDVSVPKLAAGDELRVQTAGAVVVVHGTKFSVEHVAPAGGAPAETRVAVIEGVVSVGVRDDEHSPSVASSGMDREQKLTAGTNLVIADPPAVDPGPTRGANAAAGAPPVSGAGAASEALSGATDGAAPSAGAAAASTLAAENALLADAMASRREHHEDRALALLDRLLAHHPGSPLAETACVERLRVLETEGSMARLGREATRYLADYPRGVARQEATRMLAEARGAQP